MCVSSFLRAVSSHLHDTQRVQLRRCVFIISTLELASGRLEIVGLSGFAGSCFVNLRCEPPHHKFVQEIRNRASTNPDRPVLECQLCTVSILRRVLTIGNSCRREMPENSRVIWLPVSIILFADYRIGERVENAGCLLPVPL